MEDFRAKAEQRFNNTMFWSFITSVGAITMLGAFCICLTEIKATTVVPTTGQASFLLLTLALFLLSAAGLIITIAQGGSQN